jgi:hypothetical protein
VSLSPARAILLNTVSEKASSRSSAGWPRATSCSSHTRDSRGSAPGLPDVFAIHVRRRIVLVVELKTAAGRVRPAQRTWLRAFAELAATGVEGSVPQGSVRIVSGLWRPVDAYGARKFVLGFSEAPPHDAKREKGL